MEAAESVNRHRRPRALSRHRHRLRLIGHVPGCPPKVAGTDEAARCERRDLGIRL
jgi:hypothetical protein